MDNDSLNQMALNAIDGARRDQSVTTLEFTTQVFNSSVLNSLEKTLNHDDRIWEKIEFGDCSGEWPDAIGIVCKSGRVRHIQLTARKSKQSELAKVLADAMKVNQSMPEIITIDPCMLSATSMSIFANGFQSNTTLQELHINRKLDDGTAMSLVEGLRNNKTLKALSLRSCGIDDEDLHSILSSIQAHPKMERLDLSRNRIRYSLDIFGLWLSSDQCKLERLDLCCQSVKRGLLDLKTFGSGLAKNKTLRFLNLSRNQITNESMQYFVEHCLTQNSCLEELDVSQCGNSAEAPSHYRIDAFAKHLPKLKIRRLNIYEPHPIQHHLEIGKRFMDGISRNLHLQYLKLPPNIESCFGMEKVKQALYLNWGGRRFLSADDAPISLLPKVLEKSCNHRGDDGTRATIIYVILQGQAGIGSLFSC